MGRFETVMKMYVKEPKKKQLEEKGEEGKVDYKELEGKKGVKKYEMVRRCM